MTRLLVFLFTLLVSVSAQSQSVYKCQLRISYEDMRIVRGKHFRVRFRVSYNPALLRGGQLIHITPVLRCDSVEQLFTPVSICGSERLKYENRQWWHSSRQKLSTPVIKRDDKQGVCYFDYDAHVPFQEWMKRASLYIYCNASSWRGSPQLYKDKLIERFLF